MSDIFKIIHGKKENEDSPQTFSLALKINIDQRETHIPLTVYLPYEGLKQEINSIKDELNQIEKKLEAKDKENASRNALGIDDNSSSQDIWNVLSTVADNELMIEHFNNLSEIKRRELADYIFANCNMFSGKGTYFSAHYVQETGLLIL